MKERARDLAIGMTVIVALVVLMGLIVLFTGLPEILQPGYEIRIVADTTYDVHGGDSVHLAGIQIGRVVDISFTDPDQPAKGVTFVAKIDPEVNLPGNVQAYIFTKGVVGAAYLELKDDGPQRTDPATGKVLEVFPKDGSMAISIRHVGSGLIPPELTDAIKSVMKLADNLNQLVAPEPALPVGVPTTAPAVAEPAGLKGTMGKLNRALDALSAVLGDVENQKNIKTSLANLTQATSSAREAMDSVKQFAEEARQTASRARTTAEDFSKLATKSTQRIDELIGKLITDAEQISKLMAIVNRAAAKIESGEGTAGKLLNDPELYNSFLAATRQLNKLLIEFRQLVETWRKSGVELKLK